MKVNQNSGTLVEITLSKRNLLALLAKVDDPTSVKTLSRFDDGTWVTIHVEPDAAHYRDREPGHMDAETERFIKNHEAGEGDSGILDPSAPDWIRERQVRIA